MAFQRDPPPPWPNTTTITITESGSEFYQVDFILSNNEGTHSSSGSSAATDACTAAAKREGALGGASEGIMSSSGFRAATWRNTAATSCRTAAMVSPSSGRPANCVPVKERKIKRFIALNLRYRAPDSARINPELRTNLLSWNLKVVHFRTWVTGCQWRVELYNPPRSE